MKTKENIEKSIKNSTNKIFYKSNPRGISLIVLVITIIVIIILATAIIVSVLNNNPLSEANKARFQSDRDNMQSIFTNTVAKVMAVNQGSIKIYPGKLNEVTSGVNKTTGVVKYEMENGADSSKKSGTITFANEKNTENVYYTGKQLPIYKAGETAWYVDSEGILMLEIDKQIFGEGNKDEIGKGEEVEKIEVSKDEFNTLKLKVTKLEEENNKLKSELDKTKNELEIANNRIKELEVVSGQITAEAKRFTDKNASVATIPVGFAIVPGKDVIKNGLVISDIANDTGNLGNQFVWIPVDNMNTFVREQGYYNGSLQTNYPFAHFNEPLNYNGVKASEEELQEYNNMINSVKEYKGFYIGRYEISNDENNKAQSKKNKTPWVNIKWGNSMSDLSGGIVEKARSMYPYRNDLTKGQVVSTLVYGVCWDETIRFIKKNYPGIERNSSGHGNYGTGGTMLTGSKEEYALNNIYDMAGNALEWTMEARSTSHCACRGGNYENTGLGFPISYRIYDGTTGYGGYLGGRCQLYIK